MSKKKSMENYFNSDIVNYINMRIIEHHFSKKSCNAN